jgi:hypothetical protein
MVFQQQEKWGETIVGRCCFVDEESEELLDCSVLAVESAEQWCFSIGKMMKSCWQWCFSNGKEKDETIVGRCCFVDEECEEMADCSVLAVGRTKSVEQWCFSIGKNDEKLLAMVFQQQKRKGETIAGRCCFVDEEW